ncbi:hypothetical protein BGX38DRAFT_874890 [Terfezia claveryi]|nr:hypothetical protein BGX38DRAFT_874890 [Terfezia claveryi]
MSSLFFLRSPCFYLYLYHYLVSFLIFMAFCLVCCLPLLFHFWVFCLLLCFRIYLVCVLVLPCAPDGNRYICRCMQERMYIPFLPRGHSVDNISQVEPKNFRSSTNLIIFFHSHHSTIHVLSRPFLPYNFLDWPGLFGPA